MSGRTVLITGAGSGIGRAMAEAFAAAGERVVAADVRQDRADATAAALRAAGADAVAIAADVSVAADADRLVAFAMEHGGVDVLCNNAGIMDRHLGAHEVDEAAWDRVLAINLKGPYLMAHRVIPAMLERRRGVIINTASVAGFRGGRAGAAYTASKHGLIGLTSNIAAFYGRDGIRCVAICPGGVATNIMEAGESSEMGRRLYEGQAYRPPPTRPEQIASIAVFLASDGAAYINGAAIVADGGMTAF